MRDRLPVGLAKQDANSSCTLSCCLALIIADNGVFHGIDTFEYRKNRANTGYPRLVCNRMGVNHPVDDEYWMRQALQQAQKAADMDEVPVGAVLVDKSGVCLASGHNQPITAVDPTAHAEIVVLREAAKFMSNYRLPGTALFVTLEPCTMCVGALVHARVARIVYGASEPKTGAIESAQRLFETCQFNHYPEIKRGVLEAQSQDLLGCFFQQKRQTKKSEK